MIVKITYPVIMFNTIEKEMNETEFEELKSKPLQEQARYIIALDEQLDLPNILPNERDIIGALDTDYATIKAA